MGDIWELFFAVMLAFSPIVALLGFFIVAVFTGIVCEIMGID